jgi:predicted DNA-binding transcriptional regulator YafY
MVATALLSKRRLHIRYYSRVRDDTSERDVSPQLLIHHRGNWYVGAWCHSQDAMRSFAMDAIEHAEITDKSSRNLPKKDLGEFIGQGYGIFSGADVRWARLEFAAERARWVSRELWHPKQRSQVLPSGELILEVPFTDIRELAMDILRHGQHVRVLEPTDLKRAVVGELKKALSNYSG